MTNLFSMVTRSRSMSLLVAAGGVALVFTYLLWQGGDVKVYTALPLVVGTEFVNEVGLVKQNIVAISLSYAMVVALAVGVIISIIRNRDVGLRAMFVKTTEAGPIQAMGPPQKLGAGCAVPLTNIQPENPNYPTGKYHGRKVGRWVGTQLRREMGLPKYTTANRVVAMQRIEQYRREHLPHLRHADISGFVQVAFYYVFQPTQDEIVMCNALHNTTSEWERQSVITRREYYIPFLPHFISRSLGLYRDHGVDF